MKKKAVSRDHNLADLIGKTIKDITLHEVRVAPDGSNIRQFYKMVLKGGEVAVLACDGGNEDNQHATAELMTEDDYEEFLAEIESDDSEDEEIDEDEEFDEDDGFGEGDDDFEDDGYDEDLD